MRSTQEPPGKRVGEALALVFLMATLVLPVAAQQQGTGRRDVPVPLFRQPIAGVRSPIQQGTYTQMADSQLQSPPAEQTRAAPGRIENEVRITQTPFTQQISMPIARLWSGHMQITGFARCDSMENLLWGPPGSGNFPAAGNPMRTHVGVWAPNQDQSYGFTLILHRGAPGGGENPLRPNQWIFRVVRVRRS